MPTLTDLQQTLIETDFPNIIAEPSGDNLKLLSYISNHQSGYDNQVDYLDNYFDIQIDKLKQYMNMFFLYDGYDSKNFIILKDLEKKLLNQKKDIKLLYEKKDNLRSTIDYSKEEIIEDKNKNTIYIINIIILVLICIILFVIIIFIPPNTNNNINK